MKLKLFLSLFFINLSLLAQVEVVNSQVLEPTRIKPVFFQFDLSLPFVVNQDRGNNTLDSNKNNDWFVPDGLGAKFGYGLQKDKWLGLSLHTGLDWNISEKLVAVPVYGNLRLSPYIGNDVRLVFQGGLGRGFALGRGSLSGLYQKFSIGLESDEDLNIFIEGSGYKLGINNQTSIVNLSIGLSLRTF
jgi:hypothetical protein